MLVANSFDLWQKDAFFSAAEEVQESADIMESAYRKWVRRRREGVTPQDLDELCRELQISLGTAKWQLEEFEKAVRLSYRNRANDITTTRHRQFVAAIENQISHVEAALRECFNEEGKEPLRWVNLDEEERDDLAAFLSATPGTLQATKDERTKHGASIKISLPEKQYTKKDLDLYIKDASSRDIPREAKDVTCNINADYVIELEAKEIPETRDDIYCQADRTVGARRTWSSPDIAALKIVIDDGEEPKKELMPSIEVTPKEKGLKSMFWKQRHGDYPQAKGGMLGYTQLRGINWINQLLGRLETKLFSIGCEQDQRCWSGVHDGEISRGRASSIAKSLPFLSFLGSEWVELPL